MLSITRQQIIKRKKPHECLEVIARRGVDLNKCPETKMYLNNSPVALWIASLTIKVMFRCNKLVQRSSLHGLGDAQEVQAFYYDLLNAGRQFGLDMPVMSSFDPDIRQFAGAKP